MQPTTNGTAAVSFLDDIKRLFEGGDREEAFDLLDSYLGENPKDVEAELLKVELCLKTERDLVFVGQTLPRLEDHLPGDERIPELRIQAEEKVRQRLTDGRRATRRRYWSDAARYFDSAVNLAPDDPSVALAAGMAMIGAESASNFEDDDEGSSGPLRSLLGSRSSSAAPKPETSVRYFQLALDRSTAGEPVYTLAAEQLIKHWLGRNKIDEVLQLLEKLPPSENKLHDLAATTAHQMISRALDAAARFLRIKETAIASTILTDCAAIMPDLRRIHLLRAEEMIQSRRPQKALASYRRTLRRQETLPPPSVLMAAKTVWDTAQNQQIPCPHCGKTIKGGAAVCPICERPLEQIKLLEDRYSFNDSDDVLMSRVGIAELAAQQENWDEAAKQINAVLAALPANSPIASELQKLKTQWRTQQRKLTQELPPASQAVNRWQQEGLSPGVLSAIDHACQIMPAAWFDVPLNERRKLTLATIEAGYFDTARLLLKTAFADNLKRKTVDNLRTELDQALQMRAVSETEAARQALASDNAEHAVHLADIALGFKPDYFPARLVRAEARLAAGQDIAALGDFRALMDKAGDAALQHTARLGAARTLEARRDYEEALTLLDGLTDDTAAALRNRLERRQRGEPVVHLEQVNSVVMHDTLTRATTETHYQGYFAVAVRAARRPWNISLAEWNDRLWAAGFEFVQVLGGLRNFVGDPVFAMRIISKPHPLLPERGHLTLAFLVRVSAPDETTCRELALNLWWTINSVLPLAQDYIYDFQAVADETELKSLLVPFDATNIAEVVRREEVPLQDDDRYAIYPFTPGSNDLQNVCWTLLRQKVPAMISVHLLPTDLMAWERAAFDQIMLGEPTVAPDMQPDSGQIGFRDPVSQWWQGNPQWGRAQANRRMVDALRTQAYVLRVSVASGAGSSSLLPEIVAAALFGPSRPVGEALYGGYEVIRASRADEFEIARHNLAALDIEGWVYTAAPENAARLRHLMGESEAAMVFRLPIPMSQAIPGVPVMEVKPIAPPSNLPMHGVMWGESVARVSGSSLRVMQSVDDRRRHAYVVGKTGTGKSTLLKNLALQDIEAGHGVCVIDPHSDLIEDILARIPEHRVEDVILFDPSDEDRPVGLNLMEAHSEAEKHRIVTEFIGMLVRMYDPHQQGIVGPRFQHNVRNAMLTAMCTDESTLVEVVRALTDIEYVKKILPRIDDPLVRNYWEKQIPSTSDFHKSEILDYLVSKFNRFVGDRLIRNIIGQRHTTIDFRQVMDQKKVLLVNLSKGKIGPESAQFLGLLLVQRLLITALSRADVAPDQRPDFFLYVDEFQNFATELFATVLSEGRKYGVAVTVANQYLTQLDHTIREAIFGNVGTILSFRLGTQDAAILAPEMYPVFGADDLLNLPKFTTCSKLLADGVAARPFTMRTVLDTRPPDQARALRIRELSRQKYGRDAAEVSEDVLARFRASLRSS